MSDQLKIVLIGVGSREFGPATIRDILLSDPINERDLKLVLMDINPKELTIHQKYAENVAEQLDRHPKIVHTTKLEEALAGADAVVTAIETKRYFYWAQDFHIPRKHGFKQIYGENGGPGGLFHALRNAAPLADVAKTIEQVCPQAWMLNYTNPLTKLCEIVQRSSSLNMVGLCHGVFQGMKQLGRILQMTLDQIEARACGINHFTWFQQITDRKTGQDLYPLLIKKDRKAEWLAEWDEIALSRILMRVFGLYPSPGTNHIGEYIAWADEFLCSSLLQFYYDPEDGHPWDTQDIPPFIYNLQGNPTHTSLYPEEKIETVYPGEKPDPEQIEPSGELAIPIIEGVLCGSERHLDAINVQNTHGLIPNLPHDAIVEVPGTASVEGINPEQMEAIPEGIAAILQRQCSINKLLAEAFIARSRKKLLQAILLDPTTRSYRNAVNLLDEMYRVQKDVLPELE